MLRHRWCGCAVLVVLTTVATVPVTRGQTTELDFQSLLGSVDWSVLGGLDRAQIEEVCRQIQHRLQGEYVVDLAALRGAAEMALPLMDALPETRPYAAWLRSRLDYLEAAEEWKFRIRPPLELGMPRELPPINPDPAWEREIWSRKLDRRPFPARAGQWYRRYNRFLCDTVCRVRWYGWPKWNRDLIRMRSALPGQPVCIN